LIETLRERHRPWRVCILDTINTIVTTIIIFQLCTVYLPTYQLEHKIYKLKLKLRLRARRAVVDTTSTMRGATGEEGVGEGWGVD
jgi:hypothetical protein